MATKMNRSCQASFPRRILGVLLSILLGTAAGAQEPYKEEARFLKEHAPAILKILEEAERENYREVLGEVKERVGEMQEEWEEAKGDGVPWAKLMVGQMANETTLEFLVWKFEEGKIKEAAAEVQLRGLIEEQLKIRNGIDRQELKWMKEEGEEEKAAELAEELGWRVKNPKRAVDEMMGEFLREMEGGEEVDDENAGEEVNSRQ
jgi:hypothetical protein